MRISDWSSDVCSSDLIAHHARRSGKQLSYRIRLRSIDAVCRMVGQGVGIAVVPKAAAVRCAKSAGIKHIALTDAWASRELLLCLRSSAELPVYVRQMMTFILDRTSTRLNSSHSYAHR